MKTHFPGAIAVTTPRHAARPGSIGWLLALGLALAVLPASLQGAAAAEPAPAPAPSPGGAAPRLPVLSGQGPVTRIEGSITRSSRGRKGPVRLLVEQGSGAPVTVLVAADDYCDRLGLSLRSGEKIAVEGTMVKGERPILIASSLTVDGKTVRIRDASGKLIELGGGPAAPAAGATLGGGKPVPEEATAPSVPGTP